MEELDKLDVIVERTGTNYKEAKQALRDAQGDVLEAVLSIDNQATKDNRQNMNQQKDRKHKEERRSRDKREKRRTRDEFKVKGSRLVSKVKELIKEGNVTRIIIKKEQRVLLDIPVTAGVVGVVLAPYLAAVAAIAALATTKYKIEVERP